jgi:hypothetical protein
MQPQRTSRARLVNLRQIGFRQFLLLVLLAVMKQQHNFGRVNPDWVLSFYSGISRATIVTIDENGTLLNPVAHTWCTSSSCVPLDGCERILPFPLVL